MGNPLRAVQHQTIRRTISRPLVALVAALLCTPLLAVDIDGNAKHNARSVPQAAIPWLSGGIGDEARDEMRKAAASYNVLIMFSDRQGSYLADIPFAVAGRNGQEVVAGISDGPLLYINLPAGSYKVSAKIDGVWQNRQIQAGPAGRPFRVNFVGKGE